MIFLSRVNLQIIASELIQALIDQESIDNRIYKLKFNGIVHYYLKIYLKHKFKYITKIRGISLLNVFILVEAGMHNMH